MKKDSFPQDWQIIALAAILFILCLQSCKTTKQVSREQVKQETEVKTTVEAKATTEAVTKTETKAKIVTDIVEHFDTTVKVYPVIDGKVAEKPVDVPVKGKRTTHREEDIVQNQDKKEQGAQQVKQNEDSKGKSDSSTVHKDVKRTAFPWWIIVIAAAIGAAVWFFWPKIKALWVFGRG